MMSVHKVLQAQNARSNSQVIHHCSFWQRKVACELREAGMHLTATASRNKYSQNRYMYSQTTLGLFENCKIKKIKKDEQAEPLHSSMKQHELHRIQRRSPPGVKHCPQELIYKSALWLGVVGDDLGTTTFQQACSKTPYIARLVRQN